MHAFFIAALRKMMKLPIGSTQNPNPSLNDQLRNPGNDRSSELSGASRGSEPLELTKTNAGSLTNETEEVVVPPALVAMARNIATLRRSVEQAEI